VLLITFSNVNGINNMTGEQSLSTYLFIFGSIVFIFELLDNKEYIYNMIIYNDNN
jgi:hypothetical protein